MILVLFDAARNHCGENEEPKRRCIFVLQGRFGYGSVSMLWVFSMLNLEWCLPKRVGEQLNLDGGRDAFVEDVVHGIEDGHVDMVKAVDALHAFCAVVAFCYHFHLDLCRFYTISFTYHGTEYAIA